MDDGRLITPNKMIRILNSNDDKDRKALKVFQEHNERIDEITGKEIFSSTAQRYCTYYNHVKQFIKEQYKADDYRLKDIDYGFVEIYTHGTRNIYDVAIDPFMNIFTRGNTNDGGGWNIRFLHHLQTGEYGYPKLFKNFTMR